MFSYYQSILNMDNFLNDKSNVEYDFLSFWKTMNIALQIVHLIVFQPTNVFTV